MRFRSAELALSLIVALVLCAPGASMGQGLSDDTLPTETMCDPGDVFVPDPTGLGLLWAADDGDGFFGCGSGGPLPVCNISLPNDLACDLDAVTFDVTQHPQVPPPVSISLDDGDPSPIGPPLSNFVELLDVVPPGPPVAALTEAGLLLLGNPGAEALDDDVDGFERNMTAAMLPHPGGYFFDFSTDQDNPCGLDSGDIYFAICPSYLLFCDDVTQIQIPDDCDVDALHIIDPSGPFPSGPKPPGVGTLGWAYLFSIDAASGPACLGMMDPGDIYYTECSMGAFFGTTLWADDVVDLGMAGCDNPGANVQNNPGYCDIDAISVVITTTTTTTTVTLPTTTTTTTVPTTTTTTITAPPTTTTTTTVTLPTTTTTTLPPVCATAPIGGCLGPEKGMLMVKEKVAGKEKVKVLVKKLKTATTQGDFGDPVGGTTSYTVCIYDDADSLVGQMVVARAGQDCGTPAKPCWKAISTKGYKYKDKDTSADGILKIIGKGGDAGKGKLILLGKNNAAKGQNSLPTSIAPLLENNTKATVQVVTSDADCFGVTTDQVKKADADLFKALGGSPSAAFLDMGSGVLD